MPLLPALVFIVIMTQLPFVATILVSFTNWNANYPDEIKFGTLQQLRDRLHRRRACARASSSPSC